ncbi:MAG: PKD domain-containing protein [Bacteroidales bacterium]|nr:PKD domain-containing protein [Bacteroidales bacterium]
MKSEREYNNIEEVFRDGLGKREYPVSDNFWPELAGKLRLREFLSFRPGSFNIYYLAGLIAAAALTVSVLVTTNTELSVDSPDIIISTDSISGFNEKIIIEKESLETAAKVKIQLPETEEGTAENGMEIRVNAGEVAEVIISPDSKDKITGASKIERLALDKKFVSETVSRPEPVAEFTPQISHGCAPFSIYFKNLSHNYDSCIWEFDDGGISTNSNPVWIYDEEGTYEVRLVLFGKAGSRVSKRGMVTVYPRPVARFEISEGNPAIPDEQVHFYNFSQNATEWEWDFGDGNTSHDFEPSHFYDRSGSYSVTLKAISEYGCIDSMVLTNAVGDKTCYINFPNAFVPNKGGPTGGYYSPRSDQQEEVFHPVYSGVTSYNLKIYSRMGILVFESNDLQIGWDGYYKGQMAEPGVYIWKSRGTFKNGESFVKGGDVTLLPNW